jgi:RND family efflux transporter MFP subunit
LAHQCGIIPGAAAGLVLLSDKDDSPALAGVWPQASSPPGALLDVARHALAERSAVTKAPAAAAGHAPVLVAVPIRIRGTLRAVAAVAVSAHVPEAAERALALLTDGAQWLPWLLVQESQISAPPQSGETAPTDLLLGVLELVAISVEADSFHEAAFAIVSELAANFGCERVSLGFLDRSEIEVCALSHSARFDTRSSLVRAIQSAMEEAIDVQATLVFPPPEGSRPQPCRAHEKLMLGHGAASVASIPLSSRSKVVGTLTLEYPKGRAATPDHLEFCEQTAPLLGAILEQKQLAERWIGHQLLDSLRDGLEDLVGPRRPALKLLALASALLLLVLAIVPVPHRVSSPASLEGRVQRVVVAPVPGFIAESRARAGDVVREGEVLATLDDTDLQLELRKWQGRRMQLQKEYRAAVAGHDRSQTNILRAQLGQAEAESRLIQEQLARMNLVAPFAGIVARGDLSQSLGSPVERGEVLFEVAPLDDYRIIVEIDERDISMVSAGQTGKLTLAALPGESFELRVQRIIPVSTSEGGRNFFRAEANVESPPALLRPGMEGVAKVEVGRGTLLWIWTHNMTDWLRLWLWSKVF